MAQSRRQRQADARREQLLDLALDLFAKQGFEATSTQQIAKAAGVTQGLVFHYFGSKEGLLSAVLSTRHSFTSQMAELLTEAETSPRPLGDVLHNLCTGWLHTLYRETSATLLLAGLALTNPSFGTQLTETIATTQQMLETVLRQRREAGELDEAADLQAAAHDILTPVIMFFLVHHASPRWQTEAARFVDSHCALWQRALATRSLPSSAPGMQ